jgi:branched-chain amino acid aminotransferase
VTPVAQIADWTFEVGDVTKTLMADYVAAVQPKKAFAAA